MDTLKKNSVYTVKIESYTSDGDGVAHIDGRAVFVPKTIVGETWEILILKVTVSVIYAKGIRVILPSPLRVDPKCAYYARCGGCSLQHMSYSEQINFKLNKVNDALTRIGKQTVTAKVIIPCEKQFHYRNKCVYQVRQLDGKACFGFYRQNSHALIPVESCEIQTEISSKCAAAVIDFMNERNIPAYDELTCKGTVRNVFVRTSFSTGDAVLCVVSASGFGSDTEAFVSYIRTHCPELTGLVLNINKTKSNVILGDKSYVLFGNPDICDTILGKRFLVSPKAFFQVNPLQSELLYRKAIEFASSEQKDTAFELYCGTGTISLCLSEHFKKVIASDIVPEAIENAAANAENNNIDNVTFICADAAKITEDFKASAIVPDVALVDPPRKGMSEDAIAALAAIAPGKIVYISCNPATLARDICVFNGLGYTLESAVAVDMFPNTPHVECVTLMTRV